MPINRAESAYRFRVEAAQAARHRSHPEHEANPDEARYGAACYPMSFSKGLEHDDVTGLVSSPSDFEAFRSAIDNAFAEPFTTRVPVPRGVVNEGTDEEAPIPRRVWEAPTAGVVYELEGPDPQAVTMPPAPELCSDELTFEMAEVYELALLRDVPFTQFQDGAPPTSAIAESVGRLNLLQYAADEFPGRPRFTNDMGILDPQTVFRGSSPGCEEGPYLSQFLLIGTRGDPTDGIIGYGAQSIDQRVLQASVGDDYMVDWADWLFVQRGYDPRGRGELGQNIVGQRLICTPRDLATYVHIDALYQAYLNACLILLGHGAPFDPSFDLLSGQGGHRLLVNAATKETAEVTAGGFALWGGPHILSLVTEVATRGLKAVRFQKFNVHLRLRPEALAARIERAAEIEMANPSLCGAFSKMRSDLEGIALLDAVRSHNSTLPAPAQSALTTLLPMAFAEGSPMHPTYGAGHATVAGACVTMLKAYFDTSAVFVQVSTATSVSAHFYNKAQIADVLRKAETTGTTTRVRAGWYVPQEQEDGGCVLEFMECGEFKLDCGRVVYHAGEAGCCPLTLEGELNKLCANISIGRNMAGVHYFSDYYDSVRMGEQITMGILEEQALGYQTDPFVVSLPTFDGDSVRIGRR
ncbi:MAG: bromoperoxidase [Pseudomonadota bacterium]